MNKLTSAMPKSRFALEGILLSAGAGLVLAVILNDMAWGMIFGLGFGLADLIIFRFPRD